VALPAVISALGHTEKSEAALPETQADWGCMSGLVPPAINRAHCGNENERVTVLEAQAGPRYA